MRLIVALLALAGAIGVVVISEIAFAFTCGERDPCDAVSAPTGMRALAWVTLGGVAVSVIAARLKPVVAPIAIGLVILAFLTWIVLFVFVVEGGF
jgi:hypothetical protein